jgi:hypothetical protein
VPPPSIVQLRADFSRAQVLLDQLNQSISAGDWTSSKQYFDEFEQRTERLPVPQLNHPDISPVMQDFFLLYKVQLARAIAEQNTHNAQFAANQLFGVVSEQRARLGTRGVPIEFQRLAFLIRELEIWNRAGDTEMLRLRANALRENWKEVRPVIVARRNGIEQAKVFDALVERLSALSDFPAASSAMDGSQELTSLVSDFNKEFEVINQLFQRPPHSPGSPSPAAAKPSEDDD